MSANGIKVGDVVAWADVPPWSMWRHKCGTYEVRHDTTMHVLDRKGLHKLMATLWDAHAIEPSVTIVALGLTGQETAAELRRLAEVFEVREAARRV